MRFIYVMLFTFVLIADALDFLPFIHYWDEAAIIAAPLCAILANRGKIVFNYEKKKRYLLLILLILLGLSGNVMSPDIQHSRMAIFKDILAFIKFPVIMISLKSLGDSYGTKIKSHKAAIWAGVTVSKIFTIAAVAGIIIGKIMDVGFYTGEFRIIECYQFIYTHPTFFVSAVVTCVVMLAESGLAKNRGYILLDCILLFMAQRFKGYAFIAFTLVFLFIKPTFVMKLLSFKGKTKLKKKYIMPVFIVGTVIIYLIFHKRFATYLSWGMTSARIALYVIGIFILWDNFPLGSGFGTFASFTSGKYYSNIYYKYNISHVDGLRPNKYNYMSDTFWPWIYGQLGVIGIICYVYLIMDFFKAQLKGLKEYDHIIAFVLMWIYAMLANCMEAYFTNGSGVVMAIILNVFIGSDVLSNRSKIKESS